MPKISTLFGLILLATISLTLLFGQEEIDESTIPRATPVDPAVLEERDIPKALPVESEAPRARPVTTQELERLRREREAKRLEEEAEAKRLAEERKEMAAAAGDEEPFIPRAIPVAKRKDNLDEEEPLPGLSPMDVASRRAPEAPERGPERAPSKIKASWETRTDARSLTMLVPAPRGQIVDRWGQPLAQTKVTNVLAIKLPQLEGTPSSDVLRYARARIDRANSLLGQSWEVSDKAILTHFQNRRWLPFMFSGPLTAAQEKMITPRLDSGLILFPTYVRHYPQQRLAAHIIGYTGNTGWWPTEAVASGDPLFKEIEGRDGLEISFDADLQGKPGVINYLFDSDGTQLDREIARQPIPGSTVVTTIDLEMQQIAEEILQTSTKRGAFVVMHIRTGEILTMASYPAFDPNDFAPSISQAQFDALQNDPALPLFARAFRGSYPPASTFKVLTALAALESGAITEQMLLPCPTVMMIDNRPFRNWNKKAENDMNVVVAIGRSCNPFFYKAGLRTGADQLSSMGFRLGFGQKTGIKILGEEEGYMPTDSSEREKYNHAFAGGYLANASIGQGSVAATPLQVCQMMAGIANGHAVPQARLVKQVQDYKNRVVKHFPAQEKNLLNVEQSSLDIVRRGMVKVVNASWGTGKAARNNYVTLVGKTGTGQWGATADKRYLAWFAGYVPYEDPEYAFAVLYEGDKGETIGGGRIAAPLAGKFFNSVYQKKHEAGELANYKRSEVATTDTSGYYAPRANVVEEQPVEAQPEPQESREKKRRGFFNRFNRGR